MKENKDDEKDQQIEDKEEIDEIEEATEQTDENINKQKEIKEECINKETVLLSSTTSFITSTTAKDFSQPIKDSARITVSGKLDGKESIEHQLDIHLLDLYEVTRDQSALVLSDILSGIKYIIDYQVKGRKFPNLNPNLCYRMSESLLMVVGQRSGSFLKRTITKDAEVAMTIFAEFLEEGLLCFV